MHSARTLRVLRGATDIGRPRAAIADVASQVVDIAAVTLGARPDDDELALVALEVLADERRSGSAAARASATGAPAGSWTDHSFDLVLDDGSVVRPMRSGAIGIVSVTVDPRDESDAIALTARQQERLRHEGVVEAVLVGRREIGAQVRILAAALWRDRDTAGAYLSSRPEGPGIDPRFQRLAADLRFEMFDVIDPAGPILPEAGPAVLVVDGEGLIVDASLGIERLAGAPPESLLGRRLASVLGALGAGLDGSTPREERGSAAARELLIEGRRISVVARARTGIPAAGLTAILLEPPSGPPEDAERAIRRALMASARSPRQGASPDDWVLPRFTTLPSSDRLFAAFIERTVATLDLRSIRRLQLHLRGLYPQAVVHRRMLTGEGVETWYVFRDGRVARTELEAGWSTRSGVARATVGLDGRVVDVDATTARIYGVDRSVAVGRDIRTLGVPGSFDDLDLLFRLAVELGAADSTIRILRPTGQPLDLAFHATVADGAVRFALVPIPHAEDQPVWFAPLCLPTWDMTFVSRVEELCSRLAPRDAEETATELEVRLRVTYPLASVRPLGHSIGFGPRTEVLLVHRDGDPGQADAWWLDPAVARIRIEGDGIEDLNEEAAVLLGATRDSVLRSSVRRFASGRDHRAVIRDLLLRTGELHTSAWIETAAGPVHVEFRATVLEPHSPTVEIALRGITEARPATADGAPVGVPETSAPAAETSAPAATTSVRAADASAGAADRRADRRA